MLSTLGISLLLLSSLAIASLQKTAAEFQDPIGTRKVEAKQALGRGASYLRRNEKEKAVQEIKAAVALDPESAEAHMLLGQSYFLLGSYEMIAEAKAELVQALAIDPNLVWARFYLAKIYLEIGRTQKAKEELQIGLKSRPNNPYLLSLLGEVNRQLGHPELSLQQNRKALQVDPALTAAHYFAALAHLDLKNQQAGIGELETALKSDYVIPEMCITLGTIYAEKMNLEAAARLFTRAITLDPSRPEGHLKLGQVYRLEKRPDLALKELKLAAPERNRFLNSPYFQQLQADVHFETGLVYQEKGADAQAIVSYLKVLELDPDHGKTHRQLAELYFRKGEYARSLEHALKAEKFGFAVERSLLEKILQKAEQRSRPVRQ